MDYKQKYEEALRLAKSYYDASDGGANQFLDTIFPELAESEDEKIRKFICSIIDNLEPKDFVGVKKMNVLAWLEKHEECVADSSKTSADGEERIRKGLEILVQNAVYPGLITEQESKNYLAWLEKQKTYEPNGEDERIRKELIEFINHYRHNTDLTSEQAEWCKKVLSYLEKQKEQKPNYCHYGGDPNVERCRYCSAACSVRLTEGQKPVKLDDDTEVGLDRALQIVKDAKGNLCGYQSDDGVYECDHAIQTLECILKNGIEQKPAEWSEEDEKDLGWHSVDECLPEIDEEVIVLKDNLGTAPIYEIAMAHIVDRNHCSDYNGWNIPGVKFWMPMPKIPEE